MHLWLSGESTCLQSTYPSGVRVPSGAQVSAVGVEPTCSSSNALDGVRSKPREALPDSPTSTCGESNPRPELFRAARSSPARAEWAPRELNPGSARPLAARARPWWPARRLPRAGHDPPSEGQIRQPVPQTRVRGKSKSRQLVIEIRLTKRSVLEPAAQSVPEPQQQMNLVLHLQHNEIVRAVVPSLRWHRMIKTELRDCVARLCQLHPR